MLALCCFWHAKNGLFILVSGSLSERDIAKVVEKSFHPSCFVNSKLPSLARGQVPSILNAKVRPNKGTVESGLYADRYRNLR